MNATDHAVDSDTTTTTGPDDDDDLYAAMMYTSPYWFGWLWTSCTLSLLGSSAILYHIQKRKQQHLDNTTTNTTEGSCSIYHRIVAGISVADCMGTLGYATAVFFVPRASGMAFAMGNTTTCRWSGVLQTFVIAPFLYNAELSFYFLLLVRYGWQESALTRKFGPYVHYGPWAFSLMVAVLGVTLDVIHPDSFTGLCDLGPTPPGCSPPDCDNGDAIAILFPILTVILLISFLLGVIATWLVCVSVFRQNNRSLRHAFDGQTTQRRKVDMMVQAFLYTLAFSVMIVIIGYANAWEDVSSWSHRRLVLNRSVYHFCVPLQGSLNFIIYFRLRIRSWRRKNPGRTFRWAVWQAVVGGHPEQSCMFSSGSWSFRKTHTVTNTQPQLATLDATTGGSSMMMEPKPEHHDRTNDIEEDATRSPSKSTPGDDEDDDEPGTQGASVQRILVDITGSVADLPLETDTEREEDIERYEDTEREEDTAREEDTEREEESTREEDTEVGVVSSPTGSSGHSDTDESPVQQVDEDSSHP